LRFYSFSGCLVTLTQWSHRPNLRLVFCAPVQRIQPAAYDWPPETGGGRQVVSLSLHWNSLAEQPARIISARTASCRGSNSIGRLGFTKHVTWRRDFQSSNELGDLVVLVLRIRRRKIGRHRSRFLDPFFVIFSDESADPTDTKKIGRTRFQRISPIFCKIQRFF
jgi:hypothetical protein